MPASIPLAHIMVFFLTFWILCANVRLRILFNLMRNIFCRLLTTLNL